MRPGARHGALVLACLAAAAPMLWMLWTSFKRPGFAASYDLLAPRTLRLGPYSPPPKTPFLRFELRRPGAARVAVAGSFSGWEPLELEPMPGGLFRGDLPAAPGTHEYKLVVDGTRWIPDPANPPPAGSENSAITLAQDRPFAVHHPGVVDRSFREGDRLVVLAHAPDAEAVRVRLADEARPRVLRRDLHAAPLERVPHAGDTHLTGAECFAIESGQEPSATAYSFEVDRGLPARFRALYTLENYREVVADESYPFGTFFLNSLVVALGAALLTTLISTLGGYAFATKRFAGRDLLMKVCLASMMVPGMIYMVPQYAVVTKLGWINSYAGMIVPHLANVFGLLLMTNYIRGLPRSLFEAARVDGAGEWHVIRHVLFPLARPAMATLFVLTFMGQWSNFLWQLIVNTPSSAYRTLPVGLALFKGQYDLKTEAMMAAAAFSVVPVTAVFLFTQKQLIAGLTSGSVKG